MITDSINYEFLRYKILAERALSQVNDEDLTKTLHVGGNSLSTLVNHLSCNLKSRYTDFLKPGVDGEKPWRDQPSEFQDAPRTRTELMAIWEEGFSCLAEALKKMDEDHLKRIIKIRGGDISVYAALNRSLSHYAYHIGQIVMMCRYFAREPWQTLTSFSNDGRDVGGEDALVRW